MPKSRGDSSGRAQEQTHASSEHHTQAKSVALELVDKALSSHMMGLQESQNLVAAVGKALCISDADIIKLWSRRVHSSTEPNAGRENATKKGGRSNSFDDHDEICEVCEKGGDLLCCDTCTLVFHLKCIRPKLSTVPKGSWSCPHCVIDDLADGDVCSAKKSIRSMHRLARGIDSDDESSSFTGPGTSEGVDPMRVSQAGDYSIVRKGKKFVLRRMDRRQMVDVGKYFNLEDALNYIKEESFSAQLEGAAKASTPAVPSTNGKGSAKSANAVPKLTTSSSTGSMNSLKRKRGSQEEDGASSSMGDALSTEHDDVSRTGRSESSSGMRRSERSRPSSRYESPRAGDKDGSVVGSDGDEGADGEGDGAAPAEESSAGFDELWCSHCLDDKSVALCAFCGCKKCYGKFDSSLLILCDHCDRETHTYCLDPPLAAVPLEDPWYCQSCTAEGVPDRDPDSWEGEEGDPGDASEGSEEDDPDGTGEGGRSLKRRRGSVDAGSQLSGDGDDDAREVITYKKWGRGFKKIKTTVYGYQASEDGKRGRGKYTTKMLSATTTAMGLGTNHHRGRGRPPGSGKRLPPTTSGVYGVNAPSMPEFPAPASRSASKFGSYNSFPDPGAAKIRGKVQRSLSKAWSVEGVDIERDAGDGRRSSVGGGEDDMDVDSEDPRRVDRSSGGECTPEVPFVPGAVGISSALAVISRAASVSGRVDGGPWTEPELDLLEQVRLWAPVQDLRKAQAALLAQKDILVKKLMALDPLFDLRDLEDMVSAQIAAMVCADHAAVGNGNSGTMAAGGDAIIGCTVSGTANGASTSGGAASGIAVGSAAKPKRPKSAKAAATKSSATVATAATTPGAAPGSVGIGATPVAPTPSKKISVASITAASAVVSPAPASTQPGSATAVVHTAVCTHPSSVTEVTSGAQI